MNPNLSECIKLAQNEHEARHDWVNKAIHWELCKKFKFNYANKWSMQNPESTQENETLKIHWDFEMEKDHLILAR